ncbi:MAG: sulfotransferase [Candidatus Brocadia sp.]|jgi:hypothetical protein
MEPVKKQFFIVGTQRSGTTLLRLILNSHSQIFIPRESFFLMPFLKKRYLKSTISGNSLRAFDENIRSNSLFKGTYIDGNYRFFLSQLFQQEEIRLKDLMDFIFSGMCLSENKSIWGNKTISFFRKIDILFSLYPHAKFIHIVRDGRDMFDSWRKMDPGKNNVAFVALDWSIKLYKIEKSLKRIPPNNRITIRYEDLVSNPEVIIKSVCSVLEIDYEPGMMDFYKTSHKYTIPHHSELIFKPLDKGNTAKWKKRLTPREISIFNLLAGHYLRKYNYEIEKGRMSMSDIAFMLKGLSVGIPQRLMQVLFMKRTLEKGLQG